MPRRKNRTRNRANIKPAQTNTIDNSVSRDDIPSLLVTPLQTLSHRLRAHVANTRHLSSAEMEEITISLYHELLTTLVEDHKLSTSPLIQSTILSKALTRSGIPNLVVAGWLNPEQCARRHVWIYLVYQRRILDVAPSNTLQITYESKATYVNIRASDTSAELESLLDKVCRIRFEMRIVSNTDAVLDAAYAEYESWRIICNDMMAICE